MILKLGLADVPHLPRHVEPDPARETLTACIPLIKTAPIVSVG
jgi:hypothetical protein